MLTARNSLGNSSRQSGNELDEEFELLRMSLCVVAQRRVSRKRSKCFTVTGAHRSFHTLNSTHIHAQKYTHSHTHARTHAHEWRKTKKLPSSIIKRNDVEVISAKQYLSFNVYVDTLLCDLYKDACTLQTSIKVCARARVSVAFSCRSHTT